MPETIPSVLFEWAGYAGVALCIGAYAALQGGIIRGSGYLYAALNLAAASLLLVSLVESFNLPAALVQVCWIAISTFGILRVFLLSRAIRFNAEERELLERKFPGLPRIAARRLFDAGLWVDVPADTCLMREGEVHGVLIYLAAGTAKVYSQGVHVGTAIPGSLLGEMTVLAGEPATATVILSERARIFRIEAVRLHRLGVRDPEFRLQLESALSSDIRIKLVAANEKLYGHASKPALGRPDAPAPVSAEP